MPNLLYAFSFLLILCMCCFVLYTMISEEVRKQKSLASLAPGAYIRTSMLGNPFLDPYNYVNVIEVKNGWVKYKYTLDNDPHRSEHHSKATDFVSTYTRYIKE